jgi:hypothetical protein
MKTRPQRQAPVCAAGRSIAEAKDAVFDIFFHDSGPAATCISILFIRIMREEVV